MRRLASVLTTMLLVACIAHPSAEKSSMLTDPNDPSNTLAVTPSTQQLCGTICDALIESYGVPGNLRDACIFECATGFEKVPDACYELVACVADHSLCSAGDISPGCMTRANDCLAQWSLANGSCRGCWQPSRTVHGKQIVNFLSDGNPSSQLVPEDFTGKPIQALLPRASAPPYVFPGTGAVDGTYVLPAVPGCGVWIQVGDTYTWSSNADVDTSYVFPGRRTNQAGSPGSQYVMQLGGLVAWTDYDWLEGFVPQLGFYGTSFLGVSGDGPGTTPFTPGATTLEWTTDVSGGPLLNAAQGDALYIAQLSAVVRPDQTIVRAVSRAAKVTGVTGVDGAAVTFPVSLVAVPATRTTHIDFRRGEFEALLADMHPASLPGIFVGQPSTNNPVVLDIWTHPGRPQVGGTAELVLVESPKTSGNLAPFDVQYGTPYDAKWGIDVDVRLNAYVHLKDRAGADYTGHEGIDAFAPLDLVDGQPVAPRLGPPRNIRWNGQSAYTESNGGTLTPTLEWDPPSLGTPGAYAVDVVQLGDPERNLARGKNVAHFEIPSIDGSGQPAFRSFTLPPGILQRGRDYHFGIVAKMPKDSELQDSATTATSEYRP